MLILEIDINSIKENISAVKRFEDSKIYAVVKANAYGYGIELCKYIENDVYGFAVSCLKETEELIKLNINKPILVLTPQDCVIKGKNNIIYTICKASDLEKVESCNIAIKINSGMNRIGADKRQFKKILQQLEQRNDLHLREIFTHFYSIEGAKPQFKRFNSIIGQNNCLLHCLASNYLNINKDYDLSLTRCGISLYGYCNNLTPSLRAYTNIVQINNVKKGEHIGYGDFTADKKMKVAVLSCGYADGIRNYKNVRINGSICKIIGRICMDMCFADITDIKAKEDDKAYFIDDQLRLEDIAKQQNVLTYELLTAFSSNRIERVYNEGNQRKI